MEKVDSICLIGIFIFLFGCQCLFGQAYFIEKGEGRVIGSINGYLDQDIYGIGIALGVAPRDFIDFKLTLGKKFSREEDFSLKFISPQLKIYPTRIFWEYPFGITLSTLYTSEDFDFENSQKFLFFDKTQKNKISAFGATVYYQYAVSSTIKIIPEVGFIRNYSKMETSELKEKDPNDIFSQYDFVSESEHNNYTELFISFNLSQKLSSKYRLVWQISGKLYGENKSSELNIGIML